MLPTPYAVPWDTKRPMFPAEVSPRLSTASSERVRVWDPEKRRRLPPLELPSAFGTQTDSRRGSAAASIFVRGSPRFGPLENSRGLVPLNNPSPLAYPAVPACGAQPLSSRASAMAVSIYQSDDRWNLSDRLLRRIATPGPAYYHPKA